MAAVHIKLNLHKNLNSLEEWNGELNQGKAPAQKEKLHLAILENRPNQGLYLQNRQR
jgi:hypothetical protein